MLNEKAKVKKRLIIITGMHRSGTSLVGNIVSSMGIHMGNNLLTGDQYNEGGYYEDKTIVDLNEKLLINLGRWWPHRNKRFWQFLASLPSAPYRQKPQNWSTCGAFGEACSAF